MWRISNSQSTFQRFLTRFLRTTSLLMIPIAANVPSVSLCPKYILDHFVWFFGTVRSSTATILTLQAISLYWTVSSLHGFAQHLLLRVPSVRRIFHIPKAETESQTPFTDLNAAVVTRWNDFWLDVQNKNGFSNKE
jgi:hypothetical protein